jgi:Xaa-Pro dipeptidase
VPEPPAGAWTEHFEIVCADDLDGRAPRAARDLSSCALLGEPDEVGRGLGLRGAEPGRPWCTRSSSPACTRRPTRSSVSRRRTGQRARPPRGARRVSGRRQRVRDSPRLPRATAHSEAELPYANIIALNEHGATLHYGRFDREAPAAAAQFPDRCRRALPWLRGRHHRTWPAEEGGEFAALVEALDRAQQALVEGLRVGRSYVDVHEDAQLAVAVILEDLGIVRDGAGGHGRGRRQQRVPAARRGHHLGLQVHDTGGKLAAPDGTLLAQPEAWPFLRNLRPVEQGNVFTIEPGIYFIDSLLERLRATPLGRHVDWDAVERLRPYGGVRIEDNVWMGPGGARNLSREAFAATGRRR